MAQTPGKASTPSVHRGRKKKRVDEGAASSSERGGACTEEAESEGGEEWSARAVATQQPVSAVTKGRRRLAAHHESGEISEGAAGESLPTFVAVRELCEIFVHRTAYYRQYGGGYRAAEAPAPASDGRAGAGSASLWPRQLRQHMLCKQRATGRPRIREWG